MARARRADAPPRPPLPAGAVCLAPTASLATLPAGTHACAAQWHAGEGIGAGSPDLDLARVEHALLVRDAVPARFGRLPALRVEPLAPLVAAFLAAASAPLDGASLARFGAAHGLAPDELAGVVDEYVAEGVLLRS
jgi:hypothetical protein